MAEVPRYEDYFTPDGQLRHPNGVQPQVPLRRRLARAVTRDLPIALSAIPAGRMAAGVGAGMRVGPGLLRTTVGGTRTPPHPHPNPVLQGAYEVTPDIPVAAGRLEALGARLATELGGLGLRYGATQQSRKKP